MSVLLKSMLLVLKAFVDLLFPQSKDETLIAELTPSEFLHKLSVQTESDITTLSHFSDPKVRATIHLIKFHRHQHALRLGAALLHAWLAAHPNPPTIIIPIPLSSKRLRERGYNQAELIAQAAARGIADCVVRTDIMRRTRHTDPQTSLRRSERLKNVTDAFAVAGSDIAITHAHVIIFDDVTTTGATLEAAKAAFLPLSPASITCVALAH